MSHNTGTIQFLGTPLVIGPGSTIFNPPAAPGGTRLLVLHFQNAVLLPGDQLRVQLGYAVDTFTTADGASFWTRPINVYAFPAGVQIDYVAAGPTTGSVQLDRFGRGERLAGDTGHPSLSNCDPFFQPPAYAEPTYDPFWFCAAPPNWENVARIDPPADVRARVARSVGIIISPHGDKLSSCSVTLVDADKVITAGHCHTPDEALASSVCFDYQTDTDGNRPPGYNPRFFKVKAVLKHKNLDAGLDYSLLQLAESPPGIPAIQLRHDVPAPGEQVFGVHHPNGAVKKLSLPHDQGFSTVLGNSSPLGSGRVVTVPSPFHVSGGSSGSGLFDLAGRIVGVLSRGDPCHSSAALAYCPTGRILQDIAPAPPPPVSRDVVLVVDRSGSMSDDDGSGRTKIEAARDAVSLFVQLVRAGTGNRAGLVSFSNTATANAAIGAVTAARKTALVGPPPFSTGLVGGLTPGGATSIGGGLEAARLQFPTAGSNPRSILLLTDGLQNTAPMIADVEGGLGSIALHAIGFGTESSLDGSLLTALTAAHDGLYMRAGGGLALEKFFSSAFGNIFETGILMDPEFALPASQSGIALPFRVCGEEALTAVAGWDRTDAALHLELTTPLGAVITLSTAGTETVAGRNWTFCRIPLPFGGERDGLWKVRVVRPGGGGEFPPPTPALNYFVNIIPTGGPRLSRLAGARRYYTGDPINPMVIVRHDDGGWPHDLAGTLIVTRPDKGAGNLLSEAGLGAPGMIGGDGIPARFARLRALDQAAGKPVIAYTQDEFELLGDAANNGGLFEVEGTLGRALPDLLRVEGNYTFHARTTYGEDCPGMRELAWTIHVEVGIDPGQTVVTTTPLPGHPDGRTCRRLTFTPRDRYGNRLGPGRLDAFTLEAQPGSAPEGPVTDLGNGAYQVDVCSDADSLEPPRLGLAQPDRPTAVVTPRDIRLFAWSVPFVCGEQKDAGCDCTPVRPGRYATEINIHNPHNEQAPVLKRAIPLVLAGAVAGREPRFREPATVEIIRLPGHSATMDDCCRLYELLFGAPPAGPVPLTLGPFEIISTVELAVTAVYTAVGEKGSAPSIEVRQIVPRILTL